MNALKPTPSFQVLVMSEESRLGREAIETAYAVKQLISAGVQVWFYLKRPGEPRRVSLSSSVEECGGAGCAVSLLADALTAAPTKGQGGFIKWWLGHVRGPYGLAS